MTSFAGITQDQWIALGRDVLIAIVILIAAHFAAKAVKWAVAKAIDRIPLVPRKDGAVATPTRIGERVGEVAYWLVWLLGLMAALSVLNFGGVVDLSPIVNPINTMVNQFVAYIPNVVGAALIFLIGFALATIVRRAVEAAVQAVELDRRLVDAGLTHTPRGPGLARLLGLLVFTLIIIPVAIAALEALRIESISTPAINMLERILAAIPNVIGAGLIIFIAYLIGRWVGTLAEEGLHAIGFDNAIQTIASAEPVRMGLKRSDLTPGVDSIKIEGGAYPPSRIVGIAILAGIVLFASIEAARLVQFDEMALMLSQVFAFVTRVLFGAVIIAVGVIIANILAAATARDDKPSSEIMAVLVRWGVIALATAVGLSFMEIASDIITIAFAAILGSVAVAVAIAFGVGGRDAAKRLLARWTGGPTT